MAHGDDTFTLKDLVTTWVNQGFQPYMFTSSSSAREANGDSDGANIFENQP